MSGLDVFFDARFAPAYERHPLVLADIGARGGLKSNWLPARRHLRVLGFEPDKREFDALVARHQGDRALTFFNTALHNSRGTVPLYVARDRGLTSIFKPNRAFLDSFPEASRFDTTSVIDMPTDTLDNVLLTSGIDDVDFIKADTQGSELYVLEGAASALAAGVVGVEVEVEFAPIYTGQPLFADVDALSAAVRSGVVRSAPVLLETRTRAARGGAPRPDHLGGRVVPAESAGAHRGTVVAPGRPSQSEAPQGDLSCRALRVSATTRWNWPERPRTSSPMRSVPRSIGS